MNRTDDGINPATGDEAAAPVPSRENRTRKTAGSWRAWLGTGRGLPLVLAGLYCVVIPFGRLPDRLLLFPSAQPLDAGGAVPRQLSVGGKTVEIWTAAPPAAGVPTPAPAGTRFALLRFYGNADRAERWVSRDAGQFGGRVDLVWGMNYPGFGGSAGPASLDRIGPAALAAFDALRAEAGARPILVYGTSLGTTAALHVAAQRPAAGLVLHNAPPLRELILGRHGWWNLWLVAAPVTWQLPAALDSVRNARRAHAPAIFVVADQDTLVPPPYQRRVVAAYAGEKRVVTLPGADHNSPVSGGPGEADFRQALGWLYERTAPAAPPGAGAPSR